MRFFLLLLLTPLLLTPLSAPADQSADNPAHLPHRDCGTDAMPLGRDVVYAWNENLDGTACRSASIAPTGHAGVVRVDVDIRSGGYDAGVARSTMPARVDRTFDAKPLIANCNVQLSGNGHWWAGPKFVICKQRRWTSLDGNWECYIIEDADMPPADLMRMMKAEYVGRQIVHGDVYLHYTKPWENWQQAIAIRENYRTGGAMHFGPIVKYWRENLPMPNWYMHSPKVGLETTGQMKGFFEWTDIQTSNIVR